MECPSPLASIPQLLPTEGPTDNLFPKWERKFSIVRDRNGLTRQLIAPAEAQRRNLLAITGPRLQACLIAPCMRKAVIRGGGHRQYPQGNLSLPAQINRPRYQPSQWSMQRT